MASPPDPSHPFHPANDEKPNRWRAARVPEGLDVPMCLCGTPCRLQEARQCSWTFGRRFFMCNNYEYDPPANRSTWLDLQQTPEKRAELDRITREAVRNFRAEERAENRRREWAEERMRKAEARRKEEEEQRLRREEAARQAAAERAAERDRMRERARRAREAGADALRKGKWPRCTQ